MAYEKVRPNIIIFPPCITILILKNHNLDHGDYNI